MCPPAVEPLADINYGCSDEVLFMLLELIIYGHSLPGNVITELNPYCYPPENLPGKSCVFPK